MLEEIKENLIIEPASLPMICEPVKWSDLVHGGYLNNNITKNDIITGSDHHNHKTEYKESLYKAINYMSSVKLNFNNMLLEYLLGEGDFLLEDEKDKNKSELFQRFIFIKVAQTYSNIGFYVPLQADWRGRIYTQSFFLQIIKVGI